MRSLMRPTIQLSPRVIAIPGSVAAFSTTIPNLEVRQKKVQVPKKKKVVVHVKKPNPGERKAFRKRIQLSNNSALEVQGLASLEADTMARESNAGQMFALPSDVQDRLRVLEAFKHSQSWNLFRKPHLLVRKEVVQVASMLEAAAQDKKGLHLVLTGEKLTGKTVALLQAMTYGLMNDWVVINIPDGHDLTNGNTEYSPVPDTDPIQFTQPVYTFKLLNTIYNANKAIMEKLELQKDWSSSTNQKGKGTLADLILSAKEAEWAWPTFAALWTELTLPGRPPLMFTLDGLSHINKMSAYRDPSFNLVHAHELTLVRTFVDAMSGKTKLANGGAIIATTGGNNSPKIPSQDLVLSQLEAGQAGREIPKPDPYKKGYEDRVYDSLKNSTVMRMGRLSKEDARVLMEYWGASGLLRARVDQRTVWEKWALGGNGVVGEMERASLMTMRM